MSPAYLQLQSAVLALCADGALSRRLEQAHGQLGAIDVAHLPEPLRFRFEELMSDFEYGADTLGDALARMSEGDRQRLVERVVAMFGACARYVPDDA